MIWKIGLIIFAISVIIWARQSEKRRYNKGICRNCGTPLRHFGNDSHGGRGYTCDLCHSDVWVSYPYIDK